VNGRKRHIAVDTLGLLIAVFVHHASIQDRDGARPLLRRVVALVSTVRLVFFDTAYQGDLLNWMSETLGLKGEVVRRPGNTTGPWTPDEAPLSQANNGPFPILPRRWVVERTFAWLGRYRRLAKDYEANLKVSEAMLWLASLRMLTTRLAA
jgi:putative transposase